MRLAYGIVVYLLAGCGGAGGMAEFGGGPLRADPDIRTPVYARTPPSSGPLLDVETCGAEFKTMIVNLQRHVVQSGGESIFSTLAEQARCTEIATTLKNTCDAKTSFDAAVMLNECVVVAAEDLGDAAVMAALGKGVLGHAGAGNPRAAEDCNNAKAVIEALGKAQIGDVLFEGEPACRSVLSKISAPGALATSCADAPLAYQLDACLQQVQEGDDQDQLGRKKFVAALTGHGAFAKSRPDKAAASCSEPFSRFAPETSGEKKDEAPPLPRTERASDPSQGFYDIVYGNTGLAAACDATLAEFTKTDSPTTCRTATEGQARLLDLCAFNTGSSTFAQELAGYRPYYYPDYAQPEDWQFGTSGRSIGPLLYSLQNEDPISNQGAAINGLADFLVTRAKAEVQNYLAETFTSKLCARKLRGVAIETYFPETCSLLTGRFSDEEFTLRSLGSAAQRSLENDLLGLLPALLNGAQTVEVKGAAAAFELVFNGDTTALEALPCEETWDCVLKVVGRIWSGTTPAEVLKDAAVSKWATKHLGEAATAALDDLAALAKAAKIPSLHAILRILEKHASSDVKAELERWEAPIKVAQAIHALARFFLDPKTEEVIRMMPDAVCEIVETDKFEDDYACLVLAIAVAWAEQPLASYPHLERWVTSRLGEKYKKTKLVLEEQVRWETFRDAIGKVRDRSSSKLSRISGVLEVVHGAVREEFRDQVDAILGKTGDRLSSIADLATVGFHTGQALLRGEHPARVFVAAARKVPCKDDSDLACALQLSGHVVEIVISMRPWPRLDGTDPLQGEELVSYASEVADRLGKVLKMEEHADLSAWTTKTFGAIAKTSMSEGTRTTRDIRALITGLVRVAIELESELTPPVAPAVFPGAEGDSDDDVDEHGRRAERIIAHGASFFRVIIENGLSDTEIQERALSVVDKMTALLAATVRHDLSTFAAEMMDLARILGMPEPFPRPGPAVPAAGHRARHRRDAGAGGGGVREVRGAGGRLQGQAREGHAPVAVGPGRRRVRDRAGDQREQDPHGAGGGDVRAGRVRPDLGHADAGAARHRGDGELPRPRGDRQRQAERQQRRHGR